MLRLLRSCHTCARQADAIVTADPLSWSLPHCGREDVATSGKLGPDEIARLDEVSGEPLRYPFWHQRNTSSDRLSPADLSHIGPFLDED